MGVTDTSGGAISNAEEVGGWADQSGNNLDLTNGNGWGPIYDSSTFSFPTLRFGDDSIGNMFRSDGAIQNSVMSIIAAVVPVEGNATANAGYFSSFGGGGQSNETLLWDSEVESTSVTLEFKNNAAYSITLGFEKTYFQIDCDGTNNLLNAYVKGVQEQEDVLYFYGGSTGLVLGNTKGLIYSPPVHFLEFMVYGKVLSSTERAQIDTYLQAKYDI